MNLGAFGKHPGWDDHIEDLGLESQTLVDVKRLLYVQGIGGNIDAGAWDKLEESHRLEGFGHVFAWWTPQEVVVGRFWSSRDGKGRTRFPMVVCAQCRGLPFSWVRSEVLPQLEKIQAGCTGTTEAGAVRAIVDKARQDLRMLASRAAVSSEPLDSLGSMAEIAQSPAIQSGQDGLLRILYLLERELGSWGTRSDSAGAGRTFHLRVPVCADSAGGALEVWSGFVQGVLPGPASFVVIYPLGASWVDLIVGEPDTADFFCVRAKPAKLPLTTEIPYTLAPAFVEKGRELIEALRSRAQSAGEPMKSGMIPQQGPAAGTTPPAVAPSRIPGEGLSGSSTKIWLVAAVVAAVVLVAAVGVYLMRGSLPQPGPGESETTAGQPPEAVFDATAWADWCEEYANWFGKFVSDLNDEPRAEFDQDPHLQALVDQLGQALKDGVELDPRRAAGSPGVPLQELASQPPDKAKSPEAIRKTRQAVDLIGSIREQLQTWPPLKQVQGSAANFQARGWTGFGQGLETLAQEVAPEAQRQIVHGLKKILVAAPQAARVEELWGQVSQIESKLMETKDPVLGTFSGYVSQTLKSVVATGEANNLEPLRESLSQLLELGSRLDRAVAEKWPQADQDVFAAQGQVYKTLEEPASQATFTSWLTELEDYLRPQGVADPRQERHLTQRLEKIGKDFERLKTSQPSDPKLPQLEKKIQGTSEELAQALAVPWITKNVHVITNNAGVLDARLEALEQEVGTVAAARASSENEYRESIRKRTRISVSGSAVIDGEWVRRRDEILGSRLAGPDLRKKVEELELFLVELDQSVPTAPAAELDQAPWGRALQDEWFEPQREQGMQRLLANVRWVDGTAVVGTAYETARSQLIAQCQQSEETLRALSRDLQTLRDGLDELRLWDESPAPGLSSIGATWSKWEHHELLKTPRVHKALASTTEQLAQIKSIQQSMDVAGLVGQVNGQGNPGAAVRVAAWRRIGMIPWPGSASDALSQEKLMRESVGEVLEGLPSGPGRTTLMNELAGEGHRRWQVYFNQFGDAKDIEDALGLMEQFNVSVQKLDARARFNVMLYHLKHTDPALEEVQLSRVIRDAVQQTGALAPELAQKQAVGEFAERLTELTLTTQASTASANVEPTKLGPLSSPLSDRIPWQVAEEDGGKRLIYTWKEKSLKIEFVRVEGTTGLTAHDFYLATTEVSLDFFVKVITEAKSWPQFKLLLRDFDAKTLTPPPPKGPCVWTWKIYQGSPLVKRSERWLFWARGDDAYPEELKKETKPTNDHPMQQVSAQAALYFASLLGCRLPSSSEWLTAYQINKKDSTSMNWNLRDETWLVERDHVKWLAENEGKLADWPDTGVFWPSKNYSQNVGRNAQYYRAWQDKYLWFCTVEEGPGRPFAHLIGNVAEFIFDDPQGFEQLSAPAPQAVVEFLERNGGQLKVIGGSALSAPELKYDEPYPTDLFESMQGYADVGFRLAFSVPAQTMGSKFQRLVSAQPYLFN